MLLQFKTNACNAKEVGNLHVVTLGWGGSTCMHRLEQKWRTLNLCFGIIVLWKYDRTIHIRLKLFADYFLCRAFDWTTHIKNYIKDLLKLSVHIKHFLSFQTIYKPKHTLIRILHNQFWLQLCISYTSHKKIRMVHSCSLTVMFQKYDWRVLVRIKSDIKGATSHCVDHSNFYWYNKWMLKHKWRKPIL